jgi:hypothetical protein
VQRLEEEEGEVGAAAGKLKGHENAGKIHAKRCESHVTRHTSHVTSQPIVRACSANGPFKQVTRQSTRTKTAAHAADAADAAADADEANCSAA